MGTSCKNGLNCPLAVTAVGVRTDHTLSLKCECGEVVPTILVVLEGKARRNQPQRYHVLVCPYSWRIFVEGPVLQRFVDKGNNTSAELHEGTYGGELPCCGSILLSKGSVYYRWHTENCTASEPNRIERLGESKQGFAFYAPTPDAGQPRKKRVGKLQPSKQACKVRTPERKRTPQPKEQPHAQLKQAAAFQHQQHVLLHVASSGPARPVPLAPTMLAPLPAYGDSPQPTLESSAITYPHQHQPSGLHGGYPPQPVQLGCQQWCGQVLRTEEVDVRRLRVLQHEAVDEEARAIDHHYPRLMPAAPLQQQRVESGPLVDRGLQHFRQADYLSHQQDGFLHNTSDLCLPMTPVTPTLFHAGRPGQLEWQQLALESPFRPALRIHHTPTPPSSGRGLESEYMSSPEPALREGDVQVVSPVVDHHLQPQRLPFSSPTVSFDSSDL